MTSADTRVIAQAARNNGVVSRLEAKALGMSDRTIKRRVASGQFVKLTSGVLGLAGFLESEEAMVRAAGISIGAVASHESAGRLHGLQGLDAAKWAVTVPIRKSNRFGDLIVHQSTDLTDAQTIEIRGLRFTNPVRTVIDLAAFVPLRQLADITDQTVRLGLASYGEIATRMEALARRGKPGIVNLRSVLKTRTGVEQPPASTLESLLFQILTEAGMATPTTQFHAPWLQKQRGRVDLAYEESKVVIEGDGRRWHDNPEAFQADRQRDNLAQLAGWTILRFTWDDLTKRPAYVVDSVGAALRMA